MRRALSFHRLAFPVLAAPMLCGAGPMALAGPDPFAELKSVAETPVSFTPGVPLLTKETNSRLPAAVALATKAECYWLARGRSPEEAQAIRAALAEFNVAVEAIALDGHAPTAEAKAYCTPPQRISAYFEAGEVALNPDAQSQLTLAVVSLGRTDKMIMVRGFGGREENNDPLSLGFSRALAARSYLITQGLAPERIMIEADSRVSGTEAHRVDVELR